MPRAYSQDLRWRAIWLTEIMGFQIDEVSILLVLKFACSKSQKYSKPYFSNYTVYALKLERNYYAQ